VHSTSRDADRAGARQKATPDTSLDEAHDFRIDRPLGKNLSFGHGIHFCLGAHLAGLEVRTAIGKLLPYLGSSSLRTDLLQPNPSVILNGWRRVELTWS
jgi:cytochrome P450